MHDVHFSVHINCLTRVGTERRCGSQASSMRRSHLVSFGFAVLPVLHSSLSGEEPFDGSTVHMQDVVGFEKRALMKFQTHHRYRETMCLVSIPVRCGESKFVC